MQKAYYHILSGLGLTLLVAFPLCYGLDKIPVILWDESRQAANAYEMYKTGNWLVTTFNYNPEFYNTKPPLLIWLQAGSFYLFGVNECALRLPSVMAALLTCWWLWRFSLKVFDSRAIGAFACLALVTFTGYNNIHAVRTGDYDALLTCFTTGYLLYGYRYLTENKQTYLHLAAGLLLLAVMTKGIAGVLLLPVLLVYAIIHRKRLHYRWIMMDMLLVIAPVAVYYACRENATPGYIQAVLNNELGGRYLKPTEGHAQGTWFYITGLFSNRLSYLVWLLPLLFFVFWKNNNKIIKQSAGFILSVMLCYLLIITLSQTKLYWYDVPVMPLAALLIAIAVQRTQGIITERYRLEKIQPVVTFTACSLLLLVPYVNIVQAVEYNRFDDYDPQQYAFSRYLKASALDSSINLNSYKWINDGQYVPQYKFYTEILANEGDTINLSKFDDLQPGDKVLTHQKTIQDTLEKRFLCKTLNSEREYPIKRYVISGYQDTIQ